MIDNPQSINQIGVYENHNRLLDFNGDRVTFRWRDYAHGNKHRKMTLVAEEFLRRFVQHVLPRGFVRIRQYGFLANRNQTAHLNLIRQILSVTPTTEVEASESVTEWWSCPRCGDRMRIGAQLNAYQLLFRCAFFDSS